MIDFHSHILPEMDDGADSLHESLAMLRRSFIQGVDVMVSTSHFYADEEYPQHFLQRRQEAFQRLQDAMLMSPHVYPEIVLGAEVLYFPGISDAEEMGKMMIGDSQCILIEPPMARWSKEMLNEIVQLGENFGCRPVIAHVDRFMQHLRDNTLIDRVRERDLLVQVNAEYFLNPRTVKFAVKHLKENNIQLLGSDCHNVTSRPPNLGKVRKLAKKLGLEAEFNTLHRNAASVLLRRGNPE